jgi:DNA-binding response OmpR family regulator
MKCRRAIVLEQDPELRDLELTILEEFGFAVVEVETADAAVQCIEQAEPEIRLIVIGSPQKGADLARLVARQWPWIPVLLTSPAVGRSLPKAVTYLPKPWGLKAVMQTEMAARMPQGSLDRRRTSNVHRAFGRR